MDDISRPHQPQRRDYGGLPPTRPAAPGQPHQPSSPIPEPASAPVQYSPPAEPVHYQPPHQTPASHHHQPVTHSQHAHPKTSKRLSKKLNVIMAAIVAAAAIFGAGYLLKGSADQTTIPTSITRQVNFTLYFPSPMPSGYTYMKDTATFQIGQVYYKFANGKKRVTVTEQPLPQTPPNFNLLTGYAQFDAPIGKAAVGTNLGESQAVVVTPSTVITFNTIGGVSQDDLRTAIANLKNIGQNTDKKS